MFLALLDVTGPQEHFKVMMATFEQASKLLGVGMQELYPADVVDLVRRFHTPGFRALPDHLKVELSAVILIVPC